MHLHRGRRSLVGVDEVGYEKPGDPRIHDLAAEALELDAQRKRCERGSDRDPVLEAPVGEDDDAPGSALGCALERGDEQRRDLRRLGVGRRGAGGITAERHDVEPVCSELTRTRRGGLPRRRTVDPRRSHAQRGV